MFLQEKQHKDLLPKAPKHNAACVVEEEGEEENLTKSPTGTTLTVNKRKHRIYQQLGLQIKRSSD